MKKRKIVTLTEFLRSEKVGRRGVSEEDLMTCLGKISQSSIELDEMTRRIAEILTTSSLYNAV
jgi:hypothetical protein